MLPADDTGFRPKSFQLLTELASNNTKDWFDEHRDEIKRCLQTPFADTLEGISTMLKGHDPPLTGGKHTMFRMNRDIRFASDKRPYNEHLSGVLTPTGTKGQAGAVLYLHLDSRGGFLASGFYQLPTKNLAKIRKRIVDEPDAFQAVLHQLANAGLGLSTEDSLKSMPRGFTEHADHKHADSLKLKSLIVHRRLKKSDWTADAVIGIAVDLTIHASPLLRFGTAAQAAG